MSSEFPSATVVRGLVRKWLELVEKSTAFPQTISPVPLMRCAIADWFDPAICVHALKLPPA
jgi:hypothetical protein